MIRSPAPRALGWLLLLAALLYVGARRMGPAPPLGHLLDPANGIWAVATTAELPRERTLALPGLSDRVQVLIDDRGVPHVFASNSEDLLRALGYVVARDRLFQMEMRWRTAAGRLSELVGERALGFDRRLRGLGLAWSAERQFAATDSSSATYRDIQAYAAGINAYIDGLRWRDLPFEYHLLGARPSRWEPVNSLYLLKLMGWDLSFGTSSDLRRLRAQARVGREATDALFPVNSPIQQPVQPNGQREPRYAFAEIPPPAVPDRRAARMARSLELALGSAGGGGDESERETLGSNNWAVAPERTASGYALLSGDPHLGLSLPSTWYEVHLVAEGEFDVYGVIFPSAPMPAIGFNRDVAWSFTNTGADVIDYYAEELDDPEHPTRYRVDGVWRALESRVEEYRGRGGKLLEIDTLYFTHRGPIINEGDQRLSMRWTVLESRSESAALAGLARAVSVEDWLKIMEPFAAPAQNGVVADRAGSIAIRSTGFFPLQPEGTGLRIRDGTTSASDWPGFWPLERYPLALSPAQGYLASANQQPIDPEENPEYLGADWVSPWRAIRINQLLAADSAVTVDDMRRFQTDPGNARADHFVPYFIEAAERARKEGSLSQAAIEASHLLAEWDRRYTKKNERAVLFEYAMTELSRRTWDELRVELDGVGASPIPSSAMLAELLTQPNNTWWDDRGTDEVEDRDAILMASLSAAYERAIAEHGEPMNGGWRWDRIRHANINHILGLEPLALLSIPVQGGPGNLNPSSGRGTHGASWRMVVELGAEVRAWTIYPGGQSGNPVSALYADRIEKWSNGELDAALFPRRPADLDPSRVLSTFTFMPEGGG